MKALILSVAAIFCMEGLSAQENAVALEDVVLSSRNTEFLNEVQDVNTPAMAQELEAVAAGYNLIKSEYYRGSSKSEYHIEFKTDKGSMYTTYNRKGDITKCMERYRDILLPEALRDQIMDQYRGWGIDDSQYSSLFKNNKLAKQKYRVKLTNGTQSKVIYIDLQDSDH